MRRHTGRWVSVDYYGRDAVPGTTEMFLVDLPSFSDSVWGLLLSSRSTQVRGEVWRWAGYDKWSWCARDANGNAHEDRPDAPGAHLFDTAEEAKLHALKVAGVPFDNRGLHYLGPIVWDDSEVSL